MKHRVETGPGDARAYIFDLDGTLFDRKGIGRRLVLADLPDTGLIWRERLTRRSLAGCDYGSGAAYFDAFFEVFVQKTGRPSSFLRDWFFGRYMPLMKRVLQKHYRARPGVDALFARLHAAGVPFAVYSDYPEAPARLAAIGVDAARYPRLRVYGPDDFGAQKPAPRPFLEIAAALGVGAAGVCVAGDRDDTDGAGARSAGMGFVFIDHKDEARGAACWEAFTKDV